MEPTSSCNVVSTWPGLEPRIYSKRTSPQPLDASNLRTESTRRAELVDWANTLHTAHRTPRSCTSLLAPKLVPNCFVFQVAKALVLSCMFCVRRTQAFTVLHSSVSRGYRRGRPTTAVVDVASAPTRAGNAQQVAHSSTAPGWASRWSTISCR